MSVEEVQCKAYYSTSRGRRYFTKKAAIRAEAIAIIKRKYPSEKGDTSIGDHGFHWSELYRSEVMLRRLMQIIEKTP